MSYQLAVTLLLVCPALMSCRQPAKEGEHVRMQEQAASAGGHVAPNHALIVGEIVEIESATFDPSDVESPCSRIPCVANVRVESVLGVGMGFPQPFVEGATHRMKFAFTLGPTVDVFPEMKPSLPGLESGSRFTADITGYETLQGDTQPRYTVHRYERR